MDAFCRLQQDCEREVAVLNVSTVCFFEPVIHANFFLFQQAVGVERSAMKKGRAVADVLRTPSLAHGWPKASRWTDAGIQNPPAGVEAHLPRT